MEFKEFKYNINGGSKFYANLLDDIYTNFLPRKKVTKHFISRILSYYIYPQNYNNLSYGTLYRDNSLIGTFDIDELDAALNYGILVESKEEKYHTHFRFNTDIEKYIERSKNLNILEN